MGVLFNTVVSVGVGVAVTTMIAGTGPIGIAAAMAVKGAEVGVGAYALGAGALAAGTTNVVLNQGRSTFGSSVFPNFRPSSSSSSTKTNSSNTGGSKDKNNGNNARNSNNQDQYESDSSDSRESYYSSSSDEEEESWDSSDETDERNHRYKYIDKRYPGRSSYAKPLEIDHTIPMAVWKQLLAEIKKYAEQDLPQHLKRALKIFRIILKNKDIYSLSQSDLDKLKNEFPAIEILKLIHRYQFSTGNKELQRKFNQLIIDYILRGEWDKAIEYIFKDQYKIANFFDVDHEEIEKILDRQRSFVRYLLRKGILTNEEARKLLDVINNLIQ